MIGNEYWATGIIVRWREGSRGPGWGASLEFMDDGFADDNADAGRVSTEGTLGTRYYVLDGSRSGLSVALDVLISDAAKLGIVFRPDAGGPDLFTDESEDGSNLPDGWAQLLLDEARWRGFRCLAAEAELAKGANR